ncbi:hypothetical protein FSP39_015834 [Pinctada imbricata]|uniref:Reverse transcriptase domain-containing protein n=1 Tax=Pinctada imbricata TaxID=66713 RepID=A0AA88YDE6_PINIB|nr:hypothetical protein FSP39_015834 [Pinctada imbricata]
MLCYNGPRDFVVYPNLKSIKMHEREAFEVVMKEVQLGRIAGPFLDKPFLNLRVSPVGLIPKKDGSWRLIHHLSYPSGESVNDHIDDIFCKVKYTSFDTALEMLAKLGPGAIAARLDIKSAFRLLPIHPSDFELLGYKIGDYYFVDKCLPFGCSISCSLFEKFATFLEWELKRRSGSECIVHYLDDFLLAGAANSDGCIELMACYSNLCEELGVPLAPEKTIGPATCLTFLGLEIDTVQMLVRIPQEKLDKLKSALLAILNKKKTNLKDLQSLSGLLSFCSRAIPSARAFNRRFYDAMTGLKKPFHRIRVTLEMKEDVNMWLSFLDNFNGCSFYEISDWVDSDSLQLYTDSAGNIKMGCAAIFETHWVFLPWPIEWKGEDVMRDVTFLELIPIVLAFFIWGEHIKKKRILLYTDNLALVSVLNKKTSKSKRIMQLLRPLVLISMYSEIQFKAIHIEGKSNIKADALSRRQWVRFHRAFPSADGSPMLVPPKFQNLLYSAALLKS